MALNFQDNNPAPARWAPFAILLVVSLVLAGVYAHEGVRGPLHSIQSLFIGAAAPVESMAAPAEGALIDTAESTANAGASEDTLAALREQNAQLTEMLTQAEEYRLEAQRLQALLDLKDRYSVQGVAARVIGRTVDAWNQTVMLDVGANDGVETGLTVMGPNGVAGQVVFVAPGSCRVRLLTDPQSGAAALIQSNRAEGIVRGSLDGLLYLENIGADVNVRVGDVVLTSGMGGSYTPGLLIGTVVRVEGSAGNDTRRIVVAPNDTVRILEEAIVVFSAASDTASSHVVSDEGSDDESPEEEGGSGSSDGVADSFTGESSEGASDEDAGEE